MRGFVDLHCHFIPGVDDGVRALDESIALLRALGEAGFDHVVATPHMRPALFDNHAAPLREAYAALRAQLDGVDAIPTTSLAAEHFFDDVVFARLCAGEGLPYAPISESPRSGGRAVLVEFAAEQLPIMLKERFFDLRRRRLRPVIAHPERYFEAWRAPEKLGESLRRAGGVLLLDVAALAGKYGRKAEVAAHRLVEDDAYYAACSDSHRPEDVVLVRRGIERLVELVGEEDALVLLRDRPREILDGRILDAFD